MKGSKVICPASPPSFYLETTKVLADLGLSLRFVGKLCAKQLRDTQGDFSSTSHAQPESFDQQDGEGRLDLHGLSLHTDLSREQAGWSKRYLQGL